MEDAGARLHIHHDSTVCFRPLTFVPPARDGRDGKEWIAGHELSDTAVSLPEAGIVVVQRLQEGATVAQAHAAAFERCGEDVDVADLVEALAGLGFVEALDGRRMPSVRPIGQRWLAHISPGAVAWIYSPPLLALYALLAVAGPLVLLFNAAIRPQARDLLWSASYSVDTLTLVVLAPMLLLKHELGHLLAGRGKGLAAELTFGHRFIYLVAVSRVAAVWKLRRRDRFLIYSAGMLNDLVFAGIGSLLLFAAQERIVSLAAPLKGLVALLVLSEYLGVAWEFQVFLKTDVYHIMVDLTDRHDLPEQARMLVMALCRRILAISHLPGVSRWCGTREPDGLGDANAADWLAVGYTLLAILGMAATFIWFAFYLLPASTLAIADETTQVLAGVRNGHALVALDGAVALIGQGGFCGLLVWSWLRTYLSRKRRRMQYLDLGIQTT